MAGDVKLPDLVSKVRIDSNAGAQVSKIAGEVKAGGAAFGAFGAQAKQALSSLTGGVSGSLGPLSQLSGGLRSITSAGGGLPGVSTAATVLAGVLVGLVANGINRIQTLTAEVRKLKGVLGSTAEDASGLRNVAAALGIDTDALAGSLFKLSNNLVKTGGDLKGVHVEIARNAEGGADLYQTLLNARAAYQGLSDPLAKNAFLMSAFGKSGASVRAIMSLTNEEFDKFRNRGPLFDDKDLQAGRDLAIAQREIKSGVDQLSISLAKGLVPALVDSSGAVLTLVDGLNTLQHWLDNVGVNLKDFLPPPFSTIASGVKLLAGASKDHGDAMKVEANEAIALGVHLSDAMKTGVEPLGEAELKAVEIARKHAEVIGQLGTAALSAYAIVGGSADDLTGREKRLAESFDAARTASSQLKQGLDELIGVHVSAEQAEINYQAKVDALTASFQTNGASMDTSTEAGRNNMSAILDLITGTTNLAVSQRDEKQSVEQVTESFGAHIAQLRGVLEAAGLTEEQIQGLIDKYGLVPDSVSTKIAVIGIDDALGGVFGLIKMLSSLPTTKNITVATHYETTGQRPFGTGPGFADGGIVKYFASGGTENHVAQVAPAGVTRVWNEPETGGEAYIPLTPTKRDRSTDILRAVADSFGYGLTRNYASGGMPGPVGRPVPIVAGAGQGWSPGTGQPPAAPTIIDYDRLGRSVATALADVTVVADVGQVSRALHARRQGRS
jgi:hypothetical protein